MVETAEGKFIVISPILRESLITLRIVDHLSGAISPIFFEGKTSINQSLLAFP